MSKDDGHASASLTIVRANYKRIRWGTDDHVNCRKQPDKGILITHLVQTTAPVRNNTASFIDPNLYLNLNGKCRPDTAKSPLKFP